MGLAVRHEDASLLSRLNGALRIILANGTYERINARYFPFSIY
ncbi:MAG: transporter substrate-binding domain-containing protein [Chloroflexi bacterium]|nr:transporter substrate-binding domain-containing protein [Chloroflexota bacterium]